MITKLYSFYDTPFDHHVCHLFEHLVLRSFLHKLTTLGYSRSSFGWLHGNTVDSTIFFDLGTSSDEIVELFESHLQNLDTFSNTLVSQSLKHIEAEMTCIITVTDKALLHHQLEQLSIAAGGDGPEKSTPSQESPLKIVDAPRSFKEIAILVNVFSSSEEVQKSFLGLHPAILDIIRDGAIDKETAYPTGKSALAINSEGIGIAWRFTVKKDIDIQVLEDATNQYINELDLTEITKHGDLYRKNVVNNPLGNAQSIQFYDQTSLRSTREELADLATDTHLKTVVNSMTVRFLPLKGKLKRVGWDY